MEIDLSGEWETGTDRRYTRSVTLPGLTEDPGTPQKGRLWFRRKVRLPQSSYTRGSFLLMGARFAPELYLNGRSIGRREGGMGPLRYETALPEGEEFLLEIALAGLEDLPPEDASRIPEADRWRSNVSSGIWDKVLLRLHGEASFRSLFCRYDAEQDEIILPYEVDGAAATPCRLVWELHDRRGNEAPQALCRASGEEAVPAGGTGTIHLPRPEGVRPWSPEEPRLYNLTARLETKGRRLDTLGFPAGFSDFRCRGVGFTLNGNPVRLRAASIVWHRWLLDPEAAELAWDARWFEEKILLPLKEMGANCLRFHLGMPPEEWLALCDQHGFLVQAEWIFFHGCRASRESMVRQWDPWLRRLFRRPSVALVHPWNETEPEQLAAAKEAVEELCRALPPFVLSHRDVYHFHKYWWSLFENLGLYYDAASQLDKPVMADEYGGNYLDGRGDPGEYPMVNEALLRFLGEGHRKADRLRLQALSHGKISEYWRRIGAAGFSPFCLLGSPQDGSHLFDGPLREGRFKPAVTAMEPAYRPVSASLELWDRNFFPGQKISAAVHVFNDGPAELSWEVRLVLVLPGEERELWRARGTSRPYEQQKRALAAALPEREGPGTLEARLFPDAAAHPPTISSWEIRQSAPRLPAGEPPLRLGIAAEEEELRRFFTAQGAALRSPEEEDKLILLSRKGWRRCLADPARRRFLREKLDRGVHLLFLDAGPDFYGWCYDNPAALFETEQPRRNQDPPEERELVEGVFLEIGKIPEGESFIHPGDETLFYNLPPLSRGIWNGLRGGLIQKALEIQPVLHNPEQLRDLLLSKGADPDKLRNGQEYFFAQAGGFYAFSAESEGEAQKALRARLRFLVEDAPALAGSLDPEGALASGSTRSLLERDGSRMIVEKAAPLVRSGRGLTHAPVTLLSCGPGRGKILISTLITAGRLAPEGPGGEELYGLRRCPAASQFVLNLTALLRREG